MHAPRSRTRFDRWRFATLVGVLGLAIALPVAPSLAAKGCCADPARFHYDVLPPQGSVDLVINSSSPTFEFQSGPSAFRAFALPPASRPYYIEVRSFISGGSNPDRARVFYPVVAVLTDDFLVSRSTDLESLHFDLPLFEKTTDPAYRLVLPIDPSNPHERYIVVFTPAHLNEGRTLPLITTPENAAEAAKIAYLGAAQYGRLRITLRPGEADPAAPAAPADAAAH